MGNHGIAHDAPSAILFSIGSFEFHTYALCIMLGMLASILSVAYLWRRQQYSTDLLLLIIVVVIPVSILGGHIWYVIGNPNDTNPWYAFWTGGLAIQGAVMFSTLAGVAICIFNRNVVDVKKAFSIVVPNILIGQVIGRWGNFANHEVFGQLTSYESVSWLGSWISENMFFNTGAGVSQPGYYVPLFFYESLINLAGWFFLVWFLQTKGRRAIFKPGSVGSLYLVWYGIVRLILEPLRNPSDILYWGSIQASSAMAIIYLAVGLMLLSYFQFLPNRYIWSQEDYDWIIPLEKISKRSINASTNQK